MLAFAKNITQTDPKHPQEDKNPELKEYMDYQRKLKHERIVFHSLEHGKTDLQRNMQTLEGDEEKLQEYLQQAFPLSHPFADADTLMIMLRKLINSHNASQNWYRMNAYHYALVYDCMKCFLQYYNRLTEESPEKAESYGIAEGVAIDFDDWSELYFPDLDFHIGKKLDYTQYPFAKRNQAIEEKIDQQTQNGTSREEALQAIKDDYEIEDSSIKVLLNQKISKKDLELFYTSVDNPIYEYLTQKQEGSWGTVDGESVMDDAYSMGSHLKVWVWKKRESKP